MTGAFKVPDREQERLIRECGMDPGEFVVILNSEQMLCLLHSKTRHEVMICPNRRVEDDRR